MPVLLYRLWEADRELSGLYGECFPQTPFLIYKMLHLTLEISINSPTRSYSSVACVRLLCVSVIISLQTLIVSVDPQLSLLAHRPFLVLLCLQAE